MELRSCRWSFWRRRGFQGRPVRSSSCRAPRGSFPKVRVILIPRRHNKGLSGRHPPPGRPDGEEDVLKDYGERRSNPFLQDGGLAMRIMDRDIGRRRNRKDGRMTVIRHRNPEQKSTRRRPAEAVYPKGAASKLRRLQYSLARLSFCGRRRSLVLQSQEPSSPKWKFPEQSQ